MQIYLPSTNNKWQNGWDTVGYNQTWSSEPIDSLTWLVTVCGKIGNLRIGELDARSLSLPEMCLYKKLYKKFKLRVQAHYTIFQVFAKHNYLLSWWKDGRNFGRSQEVYALEFNLLYLVSLRKILSIEVHSWKPSLNQIVYISNRIKKMTRTPSAPLTILVQEMTLFCIYFVNVDIWAIVRECAKKKRKRRPWKNRT